MFYQPLDPAFVPLETKTTEKKQQQPQQEEKEEEPKVQLRPRANSDSVVTSSSSEEERRKRAIGRPRTWTKEQDSLEKIDETSENDSQRNSTTSATTRTDYTLAGYMYKISHTTNKRHVPSLIGLGSSPKKRWFVFSDTVCKLYYYKQKNDSEPLGMVDISLATFYFDPENKNEGQFSIR